MPKRVAIYSRVSTERQTVANQVCELRAWAEDAAHRDAQRRGRERWYSTYAIEVAEVVRTSGFPRGG